MYIYRERCIHIIYRYTYAYTYTHTYTYVYFPLEQDPLRTPAPAQASSRTSSRPWIIMVKERGPLSKVEVKLLFHTCHILPFRPIL